MVDIAQIVALSTWQLVPKQVPRECVPLESRPAITPGNATCIVQIYRLSVSDPWCWKNAAEVDYRVAAMVQATHSTHGLQDEGRKR